MSQSSEHPDSLPLSTACFSIHAHSEPGLMPRVLDQFAKRGLVPSRWHSALSGPAGEQLHIDIQMEGLAPDMAALIAAGLRRIPLVEAVLTSEKRR